MINKSVVLYEKDYLLLSLTYQKLKRFDLIWQHFVMDCNIAWQLKL